MLIYFVLVIIVHLSAKGVGVRLVETGQFAVRSGERSRASGRERAGGSGR